MTLERFATELDYPECPRWHDGSLWISEMWSQAVVRFDLAGRREVVRQFIDDQPGGLGWLPDGELVVVGMESRVLHRLTADQAGSGVHADLSPVSHWTLNDMVIGKTGNAYVSQVGFDLADGTSRPGPSPLIRVDPGGAVSVAAEGLVVPNGIALSAGGETLVVAETFAGRLTAFTVDSDGSLGDRRVLAELPPAAEHRYARPDGICLDEEGGVWVADWRGCQVLRLTADGIVARRIPTDTHALAVVLGGPERRTLFICTSSHMVRPGPDARPAGAVFTLEVDVPGAGEP
ncbi:MAG TPA: SMP-30/gluconolactonase/LRE family protein [Acidimicrobiales bacterium]